MESETAKDGTEVKRLVEKGIGQREKNQVLQKCVWIGQMEKEFFESVMTHKSNPPPHSVYSSLAARSS